VTFFTFDDHLLPSDTRSVLQASALLEVTEFHLFELAYRHWHGEDAARELLERVYSRYMFLDQAPVWVRQFARAVIEAARDGTLEPAAFGVLPAPEDRSRARRGIALALVVAGVLLTLHLVAILVAHY